MFAHIGRNKRAFGDDPQLHRLDLLQRTPHEARSYAAARQFRRHLRMHQGDDSGLHAIEKKRRVSIGPKLETALGGVVANAVRHIAPPSIRISNVSLAGSATGTALAPSDNTMRDLFMKRQIARCMVNFWIAWFVFLSLA